MPPDANLIRLPSTRSTVPMCLPSEPFTFICSLILRCVDHGGYPSVWIHWSGPLIRCGLRTGSKRPSAPASYLPFDAAFNVVSLCSMWLSVPQTAIPPVA